MHNACARVISLYMCNASVSSFLISQYEGARLRERALIYESENGFESWLFHSTLVVMLRALHSLSHSYYK